MYQFRGWKIGSVRGIDLTLHVSLVFLLFYVILLAWAQFPLVARQSGVDLTQLHGNSLIWGCIFAIGLLVSVVLHELGHALMAQRLGTRVRSITLLMLGGVSRMDRIPDAKYAEFKISVVGPLVSLAIAGFLFILERMSGSADVGLFSYWLGRANLVLAIFNLLPAFPMDGGRVLRSVLSAQQGMLRGTRNAVKVSQVFAWFFGIVGLLQFNILLVLIAFFVFTGARNELSNLVAKSLLKGLTAGDVGKRMDAISEDFTLEQAARTMMQAGSLLLPVMTQTGGHALVSSEQLKRIPREHWPQSRVRSVMVEDADGVDVATPLGEVLENGGFALMGGIPLLENGRMVGVLRQRDLIEKIEMKGLQEDSADLESAA